MENTVESLVILFVHKITDLLLITVTDLGILCKFKKSIAVTV